ncbi:MAG: acyl-CoA dehydratase activase [Promethearchaeota archaeon]
MSDKEELGIGVDVGSTTTKAVLVDAEGSVLARFLLPTGAAAQKAAQDCLDELAAAAGLDLADVSTVSTGYGRKQVVFAQQSITEITCHCVGVHRLHPEIRTIIDVGGQDSKVIRVGPNGRPADFELNDKCSAGTGRFLEVMARVMQVSLNELAQMALQSQSPCTISSTCTVFAESEVIGRIGAGDSPADIAAGVHKSMAAKIAALSRRVGINPPVCITGGVALNPAFRMFLGQHLDTELVVPAQPQFTGALGAALLALESPS